MEAKSEVSTYRDNVIPMRIKDIDPRNLTITDLNKGNKQLIGFINYIDKNQKSDKLPEKICIQTGKIKLAYGGVPRIGEFYETDAQREFLIIPMDEKEKSGKELHDFISAVDNHFSSKKIKEQLFKDKASEYAYQPCLRLAKKNTEKTTNFPNLDNCKMKFNFLQEKDTNMRVNKTRLTKMETGVEVIAKTMNDLEKEICFLSEMIIVFVFNKLWASISKVANVKSKTYGVGFKIIAIKYSRPHIRSLDSKKIDYRCDSDDEQDTSDKKNYQKDPSPKDLSPIDNENKNLDKHLDETSKPKKKDVKKNDNDSEKKKKKKKKEKKSKDSDSDDDKKNKNKDDSSDEDNKKKQKSTGKEKKKSRQKPKKKNDSDSEKDSDKEVYNAANSDSD